MVRKLDPQDYGVLNSLVSLMMFFSVPLGVLQTVMTRYVAKFMAHDRRDDVKALVFYFAKPLAFFLIFIFFIFILWGKGVSGFLRLQSAGLVYLIGLGLLFGSSAAITMGSLYGLQKFKEVAFNTVASGLVKLGTGFSLVALGFKVTGALLGFILSSILALVFSLFQLPSWLRQPHHHGTKYLLDKKEINYYFIPVGLATLCFFILTNMDVILVKHYFDATSAGYYSVAQMVGKIVLFVPGAVGIVMFPKIVENHAKNLDTYVLLKRCLWAVGGVCGIVTILALLFPGFILKGLTGYTHPQALGLIKFFALSMTFFALVNILMLYHLSLHNMKYIYLLCIVSFFQVAGIWLMHSALEQVLSILLIDSVFLSVSGLWLARKEKVEEP
jgi:O-antigen/teichoic acid export membrane protein